jgi:hypothetical protein
VLLCSGACHLRCTLLRAALGFFVALQQLQRYSSYASHRSNAACCSAIIAATTTLRMHCTSTIDTATRADDASAKFTSFYKFYKYIVRTRRRSARPATPRAALLGSRSRGKTPQVGRSPFTSAAAKCRRSAGHPPASARVEGRVEVVLGARPRVLRPRVALEGLAEQGLCMDEGALSFVTAICCTCQV